MKNRGFTLVELLATIVVISIISLIAVPNVLNTIEKTKVESAKNSAKGYVEAVEDQASINMMEFTYDLIDNGRYQTIDLELGNYGFKVKGQKPENGSWIEIEEGKVIKYFLKFEEYEVSFDGSKIEVEKK